MSDLANRVGVVAIGRNEGERLRRCLDSLQELALPVVYVDSDSEDGSPELARSRGVEVVALDLSRPFTAARARNEGFDRLDELEPHLEFVLFVDGDCEIVQGFVPLAVETLDKQPDLAVVCGRRIERHPEHSVYNRLADMEWNTPVGEADACGGDALMRAALFRDENGYEESLIAGEEPELCLRFRRRGFRILRIDADMTIHDAAMTRVSQWWNRAIRTGHAAAERVGMHGVSENPVHAKRVRSAVFWGLCVPLGVLVSLLVAPLFAPLCLGIAFLGYATLIARAMRYRVRRGDLWQHGLLYGVFCALGKWPELAGIFNYVWKGMRGVESEWIEYKDVVRIHDVEREERKSA